MNVSAKAEISDERLEELLEQGSYGSIFNGDVSYEFTHTQIIFNEPER